MVVQSPQGFGEESTTKKTGNNKKRQTGFFKIAGLLGGGSLYDDEDDEDDEDAEDPAGTVDAAEKGQYHYQAPRQQQVQPTLLKSSSKSDGSGGSGSGEKSKKKIQFNPKIQESPLEDRGSRDSSDDEDGNTHSTAAVEVAQPPLQFRDKARVERDPVKWYLKIQDLYLKVTWIYLGETYENPKFSIICY